MKNNKPYSRLERINNQIISIIGEAFIRKISSSEFGLLTISRVKVSSDLRNADIFYTVFNPKKTKNELNIAINKKRKIFRKILGLKMETKNIPDLSFFYDDTFEYQNHLNNLFKEINIK